MLFVCTKKLRKAYEKGRVFPACQYSALLKKTKSLFRIEKKNLIHSILGNKVSHHSSLLLSCFDTSRANCFMKSSLFEMLVFVWWRNRWLLFCWLFIWRNCCCWGNLGLNVGYDDMFGTVGAVLKEIVMLFGFCIGGWYNMDGTEEVYCCTLLWYPHEYMFDTYWFVVFLWTCLFCFEVKFLKFLESI